MKALVNSRDHIPLLLRYSTLFVILGAYKAIYVSIKFDVLQHSG